MATEGEKKAAQEFARRAASKGGRARASVLSADERKDLARRAARARWAKEGKEFPDDDADSNEDAPEIATPSEVPYSMFPGTLSMATVELECHVLNDGRRVLTAGEVVRVITGRSSRPSSLRQYLERIPNYDASALDGRTVRFKVPPTPGTAIGYEATLLVEICEMYLDARAAGRLRQSQMKLAATAEIIVRACAKVGIIALIDEATGYQEVREKQALQLKLQAFIADDLQEWAKVFPDEFWYELARLEGIRYSPRNRPLRWGKYVMAFVYDTIDADVGQELRRRNPDPHYRQNHHQWLKKHGKDAVHRQIGGVIAIMKMCDDMPEFRRKFDKVFARQKQFSFDGID